MTEDTFSDCYGDPGTHRRPKNHTTRHHTPRSARRGVPGRSRATLVAHRGFVTHRSCFSAAQRDAETMPLPINFSAVLSELLAQFLFVFICASAASAPIASIAARGSPRARARRGDAAPRPRPGPPRSGRAAPGAGRPGLAPLTERAARTRKPPFWKACGPAAAVPPARESDGGGTRAREGEAPSLTTRTTQARAAPRASPARVAPSSMVGAARGSSRCRSRSACVSQY